MRVLVNQASGMPNKLTGISVYTWKILEALSKSANFSYVLATDWNPDFIPLSITERVQLFTFLTAKNQTLSVVHNTVYLPRLARKFGCQLIFNPRPFGLLHDTIPQVTVLHDLYLVTNPELYTLRRRLQWKALVPRILRKTRNIVSVSHATATAAKKAYPDVAERISVVHEASPIIRPEFHNNPRPVGEPYGLIVANVAPNKNIQLVREALQILAAQGIKLKICLIGRDDTGNLKTELKLPGGENIQHIGPVADDTLRVFYQHAKCYINTSLVEGFCLPVLEAQTFGLPVICSDIDVLREVAGNGAIFVNPHNPRALAVALNAVFNDNLLASRLSSAGSSNLSRFSWAKAASSMETIFDMAVKS
jgi:glycosyltransferase involved in cell wall biosynthesis